MSRSRNQYKGADGRPVRILRGGHDDLLRPPDEPATRVLDGADSIAEKDVPDSGRLGLSARPRGRTASRHAKVTGGTRASQRSTTSAVEALDEIRALE